ncbi:MAG: M15 family metallopeptidase [Candidatus Riflebacteria bacterium]
MLKIIRSGSVGSSVLKWQAFLRGFDKKINLTGIFDEETVEATKRFQKNQGLLEDGIVGNQTYGKAAVLGFVVALLDESDMDFPKLPSFSPLINTHDRQKYFGVIEFQASPTKKDLEAIKITNNWEKDNIITIEIPQLKTVEGGNKGKVKFHKKVAGDFQALWLAWEKAGLLNKIVSFDGSFVPRFVRGKAVSQILSNHAFGTAFDINAEHNRYGAAPAGRDEKGCVFDLVPLAHKHGFFWGGHFKGNPDGMHFEAVQK